MTSHRIQRGSGLRSLELNLAPQSLSTSTGYLEYLTRRFLNLRSRAAKLVETGSRTGSPQGRISGLDNPFALA